jgi:hypothetical protein
MNDDWGRNGEEIDSDNYDDDDESVEGDDMDNWGEGDGDDNDNSSGVAEMYNSGESVDDEDDEEAKIEEVDDEIVDKFMLSFSNGDYDTEIDNKLSSDRNLIVPDVRPTQASYNKPDNWRERNQRGVEKVKGWLQDCVECVENGPSFGLYFYHNSGEWEPLRDNEEPIVWHDCLA